MGPGGSPSSPEVCVAWILLVAVGGVGPCTRREAKRGDLRGHSASRVQSEAEGDGTSEPAPQPRSFRPQAAGSGRCPGALAALTFLAVVLVVVQDEAAATLTLVAAEGVDAVLLAAAVILGALVLVCRGNKQGQTGLCRAEGCVTPGEVGGLAGCPPRPPPAPPQAGWGAEVKAMVGVQGTASSGGG